MINPFYFSGLSPVKYGEGVFLKLPEETLKFGKNLLLITGGNSLKESGNLDKLIKMCKESDITLQHEWVKKEPSPSTVDDIVCKYRDKKIDCLVSIGGGSVLDCAKAAAAMLNVEGSVKDYLEGVGSKIHPGITVPHIAVPTTSGTGSEATKNAVISEVSEHGFKKSLRHDNFIPDLVIIDPVLILSCPAHITAACGLDAFTQLLESYVSTKASPMTDALAISGLKKVGLNLIAASTDQAQNPDVRGEIALGSYFSGITLANAGLGVLHGTASEVGAYRDIPHGVVCGTLLPASVEITVRELYKTDTPESAAAIEKYAHAGRIFFPDEKDNKASCKKLVTKLYDIKNSLKIKGLGEYGITESDCRIIAEKSGNKNNPVQLTKAQIEEMLTLSI